MILEIGDYDIDVKFLVVIGILIAGAVFFIGMDSLWGSIFGLKGMKKNQARREERVKQYEKEKEEIVSDVEAGVINQDKKHEDIQEDLNEDITIDKEKSVSKVLDDFSKPRNLG